MQVLYAFKSLTIERPKLREGRKQVLEHVAHVRRVSKPLNNEHERLGETPKSIRLDVGRGLAPRCVPSLLHAVGAWCMIAS